MPELTGIDMLLRARAAGVVAPAILITGFADGASVELRERARVMTILDKPLELRVLVEAVDAAIASH